jgi:hypothetical protein
MDPNKKFFKTVKISVKGVVMEFKVYIEYDFYYTIPYFTKGREYIHKNKDKLTLTDLNFIEYYLKFELIRNLDNLFIDYVNSNSLLNDVIINSCVINRNINKKYTYKQACNILLKIKNNNVLSMERNYDFTELEKNYNNRKLIMGSLIVEKEVIVTKSYYCCCKCYCHNPNY